MRHRAKQHTTWKELQCHVERAAGRGKLLSSLALEANSVALAFNSAREQLESKAKNARSYRPCLPTRGMEDDCPMHTRRGRSQSEAANRSA